MSVGSANGAGLCLQALWTLAATAGSLTKRAIALDVIALYDTASDNIMRC